MDTTFGLVRAEGMKSLSEILKHRATLSVEHDKKLGALAVLADESIEFWNEKELIVYIVAPLLELVQFKKKGNYAAFFDRP